MNSSNRKTMRVAFQGEPGAFSEAAAIQLLGDAIITVPRATFDAAFRAIGEGAADAVLAPVENSLAGAVVRGVFPLFGRQLARRACDIFPHQLPIIPPPLDLS